MINISGPDSGDTEGEDKDTAETSTVSFHVEMSLEKSDPGRHVDFKEVLYDDQKPPPAKERKIEAGDVFAVFFFFFFIFTAGDSVVAWRFIYGAWDVCYVFDYTWRVLIG